MIGLLPIMGVAERRKLRVVQIQPDGILEIPCRWKPGPGFFAIFCDDPDPERDASTGPTGFCDLTLQAYLQGSTVIVASAILEAEQGQVIASMLGVLPDPFAVLIVTNPSQHAAWTRKVEEVTGQGPWLHVALPDATAEEIGVAPETLLDLRRKGK